MTRGEKTHNVKQNTHDTKISNILGSTANRKLMLSLAGLSVFVLVFGTIGQSLTNLAFADSSAPTLPITKGELKDIRHDIQDIKHDKPGFDKSQDIKNLRHDIRDIRHDGKLK